MLYYRRIKIRIVDILVILLLAHRMKEVKKIGCYKRQLKLPAFDPQYWSLMQHTRTLWARRFGICEQFIRSLFEHIHTHCLAVEETIINRERT